MEYNLSIKDLKETNVNNFNSRDIIICGEWQIEVISIRDGNFGDITKRGHIKLPLWKIPKYLKEFSNVGLV